MKNDNTEQKKKESKRYEVTGATLRHLSFKLELNIEHRLSNLNDYDKHRLIAAESALYAEALFWLLHQFNHTAWFENNNIEKSVAFKHISFISQIGNALSRKTAESVDRMDIALANQQENRK